MTRKAAILSILLIPFAKTQEPPKLVRPCAKCIDEEIGLLKTQEAVGFQIFFSDPNAEIVYMLEVHADGRVARFTAQEVMDALGGEWEPPAAPIVF